MKVINTSTVACIDTHAYWDAYKQYDPTYIKTLRQFDASMGLRFLNRTHAHRECMVEDTRLWMIAKIKYGI
jgi:hypothetical protein